MAGGTAILRQLARWVPKAALRPFGRPVALHFHGVERKIEDTGIQGNHLALDDFCRIVKTLKSDFLILPLSALPDVLRHPDRHTRTAFLISDDGYRNVLANAADVLEGLGVPWALFVSTHHIDTGELNPFTVARMFFHFAPAGSHAIPHMGVAALLGGPETREAAVRRGLKKLRVLDGFKGREAVDAMLAAIPSEKLAVLRERFASERFLNWPQVAELAKRGVEIGAHAHWHWPMHAGRSANDLAHEARLSRQRIQAQIGPCRYFAYPFGNIGDVSREAWRAARDAGYEYAFTTLAGSLDGGSNPWLLPRYALHSQDTRLDTLTAMLRAGNLRLAHWQRRLA